MLAVADDLHYQRGVDLLGRWRGTLALHGRRPELDFQVAAIREIYARRTRLLKRMVAPDSAEAAAEQWPASVRPGL